MQIRYEIEIPEAITGKARPRMNTYTGGVYTPTKTKNYEYLVRQLFVYKYPDYYNNLDLSIELFHYNKAYYLGTNIHYFRWNKKILNNFINNLKDKKIYANDYHVEKIIYVSEKNYEQIEKNHNKESDY